MEDRRLKEILSSSRRIAVVGLSPRPDRDSNRVAKYLLEHGYRILPVNPTVTEVLGQRSYASLEEIEEPVDIVDVFRRPEEIPAVASSAVGIGAKILWLQDGLRSPGAEDAAAKAGLIVISDRCLMREHRRVFSV